MDVADDDTARPGRLFTFTVTPRIGTRPAALRDLLVWISSDGGTHWTRATVTRGEDGGHRVTVTNPATAGPVAIRVEASDRAGYAVRQTILDAYRV